MSGLSPIRAGLAQLSSTENAESNLNHIIQLIEQAAKERADLLVFPENSLYFRIGAGRPIQPAHLESELMQRLEAAVTNADLIVLITTAALNLDGRVVNATLVIHPRQRAQMVYSKIHMFDVDVEGAPSVRESDHFLAGQSPSVIDVLGWKVGLSICYDLRFAELFEHYQGVDLLLVPSAFLVPTGRAHWEVLLRARAIEAQAYLLAPAQVGPHVAGEARRMTYGHSLAVSPWGEVMVDLNDSQNALAVVDLAPSELAKVRTQIPMQSHRRLR